MKEKRSKDSGDIVNQAKERFKLSEEAFADFRQLAEDDLECKIGNQWDDKIKADREKDGRPCLTVNQLPQFINQIINDIRQNRPALKAHPVDDKADVRTAKIIQGLFRQIENQSSADVAYDTAAESATDTGLGFFRIFTKYQSPTSFNQVLRIGKIDNLFSVYFDPYSTEPDGSDANFAFVFTDITKKEFKKLYGSKIDSCNQSGWEDRNDKDGWISKDSVRVADYCVKEFVEEDLLLLSNGEAVLASKLEEYLENIRSLDPVFAETITIKDKRSTQVPKVMIYKLAGDTVLESAEFPAPYIPVIPVYGAVTNINGKRHLSGIIRNAKDPQKMYNYWVSAETEMIALAPKAPFIGAEGQFEGHERKWAEANTKTFAYLEYKPKAVNGDLAPPPQRASFEPAVMAITQARMGASQDMKDATGIHNASLGMQSNETSGVAIQGRQRQTQNANFHFVDNLHRSIKHAGRIMLAALPVIYDTERIERILGEDGEEKLVQLNKPFFEEGMQQLYDLTVGEYDVSIETGPSFATKRQEAAASIMDFIRSYPQAASLVGDLLVKNLDWPEAEEIANRLKKTIPAHLLDDQGEVPPHIQAQIQQMQQAMQALQGELQAANFKLQTKELELQSKERIEAAKLETELIKEQMKIPTNNALMDLQQQLFELQQRQEILGVNMPLTYQSLQEEQQIQQQEQQNLNGPQVPYADFANEQMMQQELGPQQINPTGGTPPG